jgi:hypothetical protein
MEGRPVDERPVPDDLSAGLIHENRWYNLRTSKHYALFFEAYMKRGDYISRI